MNWQMAGTVQRYRRKPLVVEAWQWWPEMGDVTCEGWLNVRKYPRVRPGDWILKDLSTGQLSIVKHPTFKKTYELLPAMPIRRALKG